MYRFEHGPWQGLLPVPSALLLSRPRRRHLRLSSSPLLSPPSPKDGQQCICAAVGRVVVAACGPAGFRPRRAGARGAVRQEVHTGPNGVLGWTALTTRTVWARLASSRRSARGTRTARSSSRSLSSPTPPCPLRHSTAASKVRPTATSACFAADRTRPAEREALADCPNILAYQRVLETERAGYLMRQWVASNLYDRIRSVHRSARSALVSSRTTAHATAHARSSCSSRSAGLHTSYSLASATPASVT